MNKQIDRQLDSHTARQTGSRTNRQTERYIYIHGGAVCSHGRDPYLADVGMCFTKEPVTSPTGSWIVVKSATHQEQGFSMFFLLQSNWNSIADRSDLPGNFVANHGSNLAACYAETPGKNLPDPGLKTRNTAFRLGRS